MKGSKTFEWFNKQIQNKAQSKVNKTISYDVYMRLFFVEPQWVDYFGENYCIIGFSEDKYDYYWVAINNKEKKLQFITYLYKLEPSKNNMTKTWNKDEKREIRKFVNEYFKNHTNENLIYLNDNINSFEIL
jgi:hypothetical protein